MEDGARHTSLAAGGMRPLCCTLRRTLPPQPTRPLQQGSGTAPSAADRRRLGTAAVRCWIQIGHRRVSAVHASPGHMRRQLRTAAQNGRARRAPLLAQYGAGCPAADTHAGLACGKGCAGAEWLRLRSLYAHAHEVITCWAGRTALQTTSRSAHVTPSQLACSAPGASGVLTACRVRRRTVAAAVRGWPCRIRAGVSDGKRRMHW